WEFRISRPGKFTAVVETAAQSDGAKLTIEVGNAKLNFDAPRTGDYTRFQRSEIGPIELPAGTTRLAVRPVSAGWTPINLRSIVLKPR
ncbi:MAG: hypothetical protein ACP5MD_05435, partial [Verrucomicrobiia bacterium]